MNTGFIYIASLILLILVVCSVYTFAADDDISTRIFIRKFFRRFGQLAGLLVALAVVVHFLGVL